MGSQIHGSAISDHIILAGDGKKEFHSGLPAVVASLSSSFEVDDGDIARRNNAGAAFVLESKGSWLHCGYHLTSAIVSPALLSLPYAFSKLGWAAGATCLAVGAIVTFYNYTLISLVLERHAAEGRRQLRFRDMADDIIGRGWGRFCVGPVQFVVCFGAVIGLTLLGGAAMMSIYMIERPEGTMELYQFVVIFGCFLLVLVQIPSFHSLRHINLISLLLCFAYSALAAAGSVHAGESPLNPPKDYSVGAGSDERDKIFGIFSAVAIIATAYGNGIVPEIQATAAPPVAGKMFKGLVLCYAVVVATFFSVAIAGYWAFGNASQGIVLNNFVAIDPVLMAPAFLVSKRFLVATNVFVLLQLAAVCVVYMQPTNEILEGLLSDPKQGMYSLRNLAPRTVSRSLSIVVATTLAAMLPFFGDLIALIGALGFLPLDFVIPPVFYNITFKPSKRGGVFWLNAAIAAVFSACTLIATVAAVRQIVLDAKDYKLFANNLGS